MQKITPFLWFNDNAEEAVNFYCSVFKRSRITLIDHYPDGAPLPKGTVMSMAFELEGQQFMALNGGPMFRFTPAISLLVDCQDQAEVDALWQKLGAGGEYQQCGWLQDRYGLSWQIIPSVLSEYLHSSDKTRAARAMQAMLQMKKIDITALKQAYEGG